MKFHTAWETQTRQRHKSGTLLKFASVVLVFVVLAGEVVRGTTSAASTAESGTVLHARIRPLRVMSIARNYPANVVAVKGSRGDAVHPGQLLAILESSEVSDANARAQLRLSRAEDKVNSASVNAGTAAGIREEQLAVLTHALDSARISLDRFSMTPFEQAAETARVRFQRLQRLRERQLATENEVENARRPVLDADQALQNAMEHRSQLQQNFEQAGYQWRTAQMQTELSAKSDQAELQEAREELASARRQRDSLRVVAAWNGTILSAPVTSGELLLTGNPLFQIADLSQLSIEVSVAAKIAHEIHVKDPVIVRLPTEPASEVKAAVSDIALAPDGETYVARVVIRNPNPGAILAGMEAAVVFPHLDFAGQLWTKLPF